VINNVQYVFDELIKLIAESGQTFNGLLFKNQQAKISRYFQIVFYSFYKLLIEEEMQIAKKNELIKLLDKAGDKIISLAAGGGNWSAKEKQTQSDALYGVISGCFIKSHDKDPARSHWVTRFENILMQSSTEQTLYDFKVGLHALTDRNNKFNQKAFSKVIKTLTGMANTFPGATGYCLIGVADTKATANQFKTLYDKGYISYSSFYITGVKEEAEKYHGDLDKYFTKLVNLIKSEPISERDKDYLSRNISTIRYFDKDIIILKIESDTKPSIYDGKYFVRHGSNVDEVEPENFGQLFLRFNQ
jgi:hypothetical protein